jgi:hypothetical protein
METYELQKSYAQWLGKNDADLVITLNTERELVDTNLLSSFDQLSAVLSKHFYKIECDVNSLDKPLNAYHMNREQNT